MTIKEDGVQKVTGSLSPLAYTKADSEGEHFVLVTFSKAGHVDISYSFKYVVGGIEVTRLNFYTDSTNVYLEWATSQSGVVVTLLEDNVVKVSGSSSSPASYAKSGTVGEHYVTAIFSKAGYANKSYSWSYVVSQFVITSKTFYTNKTHYFFSFNSDVAGVTAYI